MKFLITMNMPSANGNSVHQLTIEHESESIDELCNVLNEQEFVVGRLLYRRQNDAGIWVWVDREDIVLNSSHIGKIQTYREHGDTNDDVYGNTESSHQNSKLARGPLRPRR